MITCKCNCSSVISFFFLCRFFRWYKNKTFNNRKWKTKITYFLGRLVCQYHLLFKGFVTLFISLGIKYCLSDIFCRHPQYYMESFIYNIESHTLNVVNTLYHILLNTWFIKLYIFVPSVGDVNYMWCISYCFLNMVVLVITQ